MVKPVRIGLISDTHGLLRPEAAAFLQGSDLIVHAGDICDASVLEALRAIAPTIAVKGNNDRGHWSDSLHETETIEAGGLRIHVVHDIAHLDIDPETAGVEVVISGHSHKPSAKQRGSILYANPGSAGPRRFELPISAGELIIENGRATVRLVDLISADA